MRIVLDRAEDTSALASVDGVSDLTSADGWAEMRVSGPMGPLVRALAELPVRSLDSAEPELDELFLTYYGEAGDEA